MTWILPVALVMIIGILMAAAHFLFMRWMQRSSEPAPTEPRGRPDRQQ
jgi:hypothetical protein